MPQPTKIPRAFADSGDKNSIPDSTVNPGFASWQEGFPQITSEPFSQGGVAPKRADFNGIFNALSAATVWQQQGGVYAYDNTTDYEVGNIVEYSGDLYICLVANGPGSSVVDPTNDTVWVQVFTSAGGNISGDINHSAATNMALSMTEDAHYLILRGAPSVNDGAYLSLYGQNQSSMPGRFRLAASGGGNTVYLQGRPDGTLTWDGKSLINNGQYSDMFFSQTSGNYTAPYSGVYRVTLKGGGGGGGGRNVSYYSSGGGGGEGGRLVFYVTLTEGQSYSYTIGAGGTAGGNDANVSNGGNGGNTTFDSGSYAVTGGDGGKADSNNNRGGFGGKTVTVPVGATYHIIGGQSGQSGGRGNGAWCIGHAMGGGNAGSSPAYGGGGEAAGGRGTNTYDASDGAAGYILIEYAG